MRIKDKANIYLILALVLGALVPVMLKVASNNINLYEYLLLTYMVALPVSFVYIVLRKKTTRLVESLMNIKEFAFIAFLGILNYGMLEYGLTYAEGYISSSLATVIYRMSPILMLVFLPIILKEKVSKYQLAALMLGFAGLYIAITAGNLTVFGSANIPIIGLVFAIALSSAFVSVCVKRYSFDMEIAMFIFNLGTFVFFAALFLLVKAPIQPVNLSALSAILYVGIIYNVFVGLMYYGALRMIKTTFVTNIYFLSPFITFVFSWLILGEKIYFYYIAIAVLVSIGLLIQKFDKKGGTYLAHEKRQSHTIHDVTSAFVDTNQPLIYNAIRSGGRVLAVKLDSDDYKDVAIHSKVHDLDGGKVLVYSSKDSKLVNNDQFNFINEIIGVKDNEFVVMGAGDPLVCENALSEVLKSVK